MLNAKKDCNLLKYVLLGNEITAIGIKCVLKHQVVQMFDLQVIYLT